MLVLPESWIWATEGMREEEYIVKFYKEPGKDLVILNLADVQFNDLFDLFGNRNLTVNTIKRLVEQVKPDLITLTGDQVWGFRTKRSLRFLCKLMDGFNIPWAPVLGNHDCSDRVDKEYTAAHYRKSSSCLFRNGPKGLFGCGNYVINIVLPAAGGRAEKLIHSCFFMDSGAKAEYMVRGDKGVKEQVTGYDHVKYNQISWYRSMLGEFKRVNGGVMPPSSVFVHIPLTQYAAAYDLWRAGGFDPVAGFGENNEKISCPPVDNGFFAMIKALGSTRNVICGHDHTNCASIIYEGVRLTFALKTGDRCYWKEGLSGGTVIRVDDEGNTKTEHVFI